MRVSRVMEIVVRVLLGALFVVSGVNKLVPFMPGPVLAPPGAAFIGALAATGYMIPLLGIVEVIFGAALIVGRLVPLSLVVLAPLVVNIALFHTVLAPALPIVVFLVAAEAYLAWRHRNAFAALFV